MCVLHALQLCDLMCVGGTHECVVCVVCMCSNCDLVCDLVCVGGTCECVGLVSVWDS